MSTTGIRDAGAAGRASCCYLRLVTAHEACLGPARAHGNWRGTGIAHGNPGAALSGAGRYAEAVTAFGLARD
jgi:hypothetical protein